MKIDAAMVGILIMIGGSSSGMARGKIQPIAGSAGLHPSLFAIIYPKGGFAAGANGIDFSREGNFTKHSDPYGQPGG